MARRLKVLMSAYACEPGKGSEPGVGWNWALQMARFHDVTVVTRTNNRDGIERGLADYAGPPPQFEYFDLSERWLRWKRQWLSVSIYYVLWQAALRWRYRRVVRDFDLIHHVTFNAYRWPGFWVWTARPVVLRPLGGGQICPWRFLPLFGRQFLRELIRNFNVSLSLLNPRHYLIFSGARCILVANRDTARRIPWTSRAKIRHLLETGYTVKELPALSPATKTGRRFIWIGGLEKRKACGLALRALQVARGIDNRIELTVVGTGPEADRLQRQADRLGVSGAVHWLGRRPYAEVQRLLAEHDALLFTSLRDTSGNVVLEAMAAGLPVVVLSHQGIAEITTDDTALRIRPTRIRQTARELGAAMARLASDPEARARLGRAGRERVIAHYSWPTKGEEMNQIYHDAVSSHRRRTP